MTTPAQKALKAVVIGGSAGAIDILTDLIPSLPKDFPLPIMVVVHLPADKHSIVAELLNEKSDVTVTEARDKEHLEPGHVYVAPPDYHLLAERDGSISLSVEERVLYSRPSIDVLFETASDAYQEKLLGILLSGANEDGARGMRMISDNEGIVIVQDPSEAQSKTMPKSAIRKVPNAQIKTVSEISKYLCEITQ